MSQLILQPFRHFTYVTAHSPTFPLLHICHSSFSNPSFALHRLHHSCSFSNLSITSPTSQLILQPFRCFTYVTAHSPTLLSLYLRQRSFSYPSIASPTSQLILQPFRRFTYVAAHSPTLQLLYLRRSSFSNHSVAPPMSQALHLNELCSFSNLFVTSPTSQPILQPFRRFTYVTAHSPTLPLLHLRHKLFT